MPTTKLALIDGPWNSPQPERLGVLTIGEEMTINGHVENGQIILDEPVPLFEGMKVHVELVNSEPTQPIEEQQPPTLYERYKSIVGISTVPTLLE